jgi:hypothetical protein
VNHSNRDFDPYGVRIAAIRDGEPNVGKAPAPLGNGVNDRWNEVPCVPLINLVAPRTELLCVVAAAAWMGTV